MTEDEAERIREYILSSFYIHISEVDANMSIADKYVCPGCEAKTGEKTSRESALRLLIRRRVSGRRRHRVDSLLSSACQRLPFILRVAFDERDT